MKNFYRLSENLNGVLIRAKLLNISFLKTGAFTCFFVFEDIIAYFVLLVKNNLKFNIFIKNRLLFIESLLLQLYACLNYCLAE
ncbi:hypothetical protein D3C80_1838150 [compost metagenome]